MWKKIDDKMLKVYDIGMFWVIVMYEDYTKQSLPSKYYRELLGSALCVFNSNNGFIIENILRLDDEQALSWYVLADKTSGQLNGLICEKCGDEVKQNFEELVTMRNRIVHSFRITNAAGQQVLATKEKESDGNRQFEITEQYLLDFIAKNERLSDMLHALRGC